MEFVLLLEIDPLVAYEVQIRNFHSPQVNVQDLAVVTYHILLRHGVYQRVSECNAPDATHVEVLNSVPEVDFVIVLVVILDSPHVEDGLVGKHQTVWLEEPVACHEYTVQHRFL